MVNPTGSRRRKHRCAPRGDVRRAEHVIYGRVEANTDAVVRFLDGCTMSGIDAAVLRIVDSPGGHVDDAQRMHAAVLKARRAGVHVSCLLEGRCFSATALVPLASDCTIARPEAKWLVHNASGDASGTAAQIERGLREIRFADIEVSLAYMAATGCSISFIRARMSEGKTMTATEALRAGYVDHVDDERLAR